MKLSFSTNNYICEKYQSLPLRNGRIILYEIIYWYGYRFTKAYCFTKIQPRSVIISICQKSIFKPLIRRENSLIR